MKKQIYRFLSHITFGKTHKKYREKYHDEINESLFVKNALIEQQRILKEIWSVIKNMDWKQNLIMDYYLKASNALPATGALKIRQNENLELLKEFIRVCDKHKLDYWLDYGTLLGAVRHGGFIPWDDDIDVSMLQEDLVKFKDVCRKSLNKKYKFLFWDGRQSRLVFQKDTGAFLDIYAYKCDDSVVSVISRFDIVSYNVGIRKDILYPLKKIKFKGISAKVPAQLENYLRIKYGNYLLLPKQKHEISGHNPLDEHFIL